MEKLSDEELLEALQNQIQEEIDLCEPRLNPVICGFRKTSTGREDLVRMVLESVLEGGSNVQQALLDIELAYDINRAGMD